MKNNKYKDWFKAAMILVAVITVTEAVYLAVYGIVNYIYALCTKGKQEADEDVRKTLFSVASFCKKVAGKIRDGIKIFWLSFENMFLKGKLKRAQRKNAALDDILKEMIRSGNVKTVNIDDLERECSESFESHSVDPSDVPEDIRRAADV